MTKTEIIQKTGSQELASQIIQAKLDLEEPARSQQVRSNPDLHGKETEDRSS